MLEHNIHGKELYPKHLKNFYNSIVSLFKMNKNVFKQVLHKSKYLNEQWAREKTLRIISHQGNAKDIHNDLSLHIP